MMGRRVVIEDVTRVSGLSPAHASNRSRAKQHHKVLFFVSAMDIVFSRYEFSSKSLRD